VYVSGCSERCHGTALLQLKRDKVELENQLEQEQEALVNRLWKRMDKLEAEKRFGRGCYQYNSSATLCLPLSLT